MSSKKKIKFKWECNEENQEAVFLAKKGVDLVEMERSREADFSSMLVKFSKGLSLKTFKSLLRTNQLL